MCRKILCRQKNTWPHCKLNLHLMQSLFDKPVLQEVSHRLQLLQKNAQPQWGKMNVSQMLAHCNKAFAVPLSERPLPRMWLGYLVGWMVKTSLYNDNPWKKNLPTASSFVVKDERDFDEEKNRLQELINEFYSKGPDKAGLYPHPMFGKFTDTQWGQAMYKHLDHHLSQFGV